MENQNNPTLSILTLLPDGKVNNDVRIEGNTVTGLCTVYLNRGDGDNEFLLRTIGVAPLDGSNVTDAVRIATDGAYSSAMSQIAGFAGSVIPQTQPQVKKSAPGAKPLPDPKQVEEQPATPVADAMASGDYPGDEDAPPDTPATPQYPSVDLTSVFDFPELSDKNPSEQDAASPNETDKSGGIEKIEFASSLFPASDSLDATADTESSSASDDDDTEYQKARDTAITILGKLHVCNGWTAGKILDEQPDMIVEFCRRNTEGHAGPKYTGPRTDQVEALFKLYPDAMRKVQKAA